MSAQVNCHKCRVYWACLVLALLAMTAAFVVALVMLIAYGWPASHDAVSISYLCSFIAVIVAVAFAKHRVVTDGVNSS